MEREEILKRSRKENENIDEMERDAFFKAGQKACAVGGLVCALIIITEAIFSDHISYGTWAVYLSITGTMLFVKYLHLRKKHELIFGLFELALAIGFLIMHVISLTR